MRIKKTNGRIFGADLTAAERKAMNIEIGKQIDQYNQKNIREVDASILWVLYKYWDFSREDLRIFYDRFNAQMKELSNYYQIGNENQTWLATEMLRGIGIDLEEWERETQK